MTVLNSTDHTAGGQLIVLLSLFIGASVILFHADRDRRRRGISLRGVLWQRDLRLMKGAAIMMFGRAIDIAVFLPAWPLLSVGATDAAAKYAGSWTVSMVATMAAGMTALGVIIILWGWFRSVFNGMAGIVAAAISAAIYLVGAVINHNLLR